MSTTTSRISTDLFTTRGDRDVCSTDRPGALRRRRLLCLLLANFGRRRALHEPFEAMVRDPDIDFPYCVCWANENWTRHWDGGTRALIFEQQYDRRTLNAVITDAVAYAADTRYLKVDGKPLFLVYRPMLIPDPAAFAALCRSAFRSAGYPDVHLVYVESMESVRLALHAGGHRLRCVRRVPAAGSRRRCTGHNGAAARGFQRYATIMKRRCAASDPAVGRLQALSGRVPAGTTRLASRSAATVLCAPRQRRSRFIWRRSSRNCATCSWATSACCSSMPGTNGRRAHLEPDLRFGHRWLEAIRNALMTKSPA